MKVLTLHQPWASLIALGVKTIETRSWSTKYRGPLAIHAHASENWREGQRVGDWLCYRRSKTHQSRMYCRDHNPMVLPLPLGAIVATCTLVDVVPIVGPEGDAFALGCDDQCPYGDFTPGRFAWLLADVEHVDPPVPFRGGQGLSRLWTP